MMEYRAVGKRCAIILDSLRLPMSLASCDVMDILFVKKGFKMVDVDMVALARQCVKTSKYRRGALPSEAPAVVDCSSFVKWLYGQRGIWLPRRTIQQRELGDWVGREDVIAGDLVFSTGRINYYHDNPAYGVGHVGIATGEGTVIHAANRQVNVIENSLDEFLRGRESRGVRRYIPNNKAVITLEAPPDIELETADDIRWILFQHLPNPRK